MLLGFNSILEDDGLDPNAPERMEDFLSLLTSPEAPPNELHLKIGATAVLMRNLSVSNALVKNQRVKIVGIHRRYIEIKLLRRTNRTAVTHCIPRINFDFRPPFLAYTIRRRQFPIRMAYATTFNSCQGYTFDRIIVDGRFDVFAHGQLYTALSRVRRRQDVQVLVGEEMDDLANVVYSQLLLSHEDNS